MAAATRAASARRKVSVSMHPTAAAAYSAPPLPPLGSARAASAPSSAASWTGGMRLRSRSGRQGSGRRTCRCCRTRCGCGHSSTTRTASNSSASSSTRATSICCALTRALTRALTLARASLTFYHRCCVRASLIAALRRWRGWARAQAEPPRSLPPGASSLYLPTSPHISRQVRAHAWRLAARQAREAAQAVEGGPDPAAADGGAAGRDAPDRGRDGAPAPQEDPAPRPQVGQCPLRRPPVSTRASCGLRTVAASSVGLRVRARRTRLPRAMVPKAQGSLP